MGAQIAVRSLWQRVSVWVLVAAAYIAAARLGLALAFVNASATAVWPPTGIAIATVLILGSRRAWPGIFLGAFFINYATTASAATSLAIATGNTLEALTAGWLLSRFAAGRASLHRATGIFLFVLLAGLLS